MLKKKIEAWGFIKDPLYGYITISEEERKIIDTREFQRLHRIKQLPLAEYVYPAAVHTRFEHSLGVLHLANLMMENIPAEIGEEEAKLMRFASLLHDIGHGPFSHLFEAVTMKFLGMNHEQIGKRIIIESELADILRDSGIDPLKIGYLITGEKTFLRKYMHQIINSGIDADKLDFIKRDNFHSGAGYGAIDTDRLVNTMEIYDDSLAINITALLTFELFIMARIKSFEAIYFHRTIRAAQLLLLKAIEEMIEEFGFMQKFDLKEYLDMDDYKIWFRISSSKRAKSYLERLEKRDLLKMAFEKKFIMKIKKEDLPKRIEELRSEISKASSIDPEKIYIDLSILPSVPYHNAYIEDPFEFPVYDPKSRKIEKFSDHSPWVETLKGYINILRVYTENQYREIVSNACNKLISEVII